MRLAEVLDEGLVRMELRSRTRDGAIRELVELLVGNGLMDPREAAPFVGAVLRREEMSSTAVGKGVAIPHAKAEAAKPVVAALGRSSEGIEFASPDGRPVHVVFLLASLPDSQRAHLKALASIAQLVERNDDLCERMLQAETPREVLRIVAEEEDEM